MRTLSMAAVLTLLIGCGGQPSSPGGPPVSDSSEPPLPPPGASVTGAAFSPDGKLLLTVYRNTVPRPRDWMSRLVLWEVASGNKLRSTETPIELWPVGFVAGGKAVLMKEHGIEKGHDSLQLWDVAQGRLLRTFAEGGPGAWIYNVILSGDGRVAITTEATLRKVWDAPRGELLREISKAQADAFVALSADGSRALSVRSNPLGFPTRSVMSVWDVTTGEVLRSFEKAEVGGGQPPSRPTASRWSPARAS